MNETADMDEMPTGPHNGAGRYEISVVGHLAPRWAARFEGALLTHHDDGTTVIHASVADQSALHGLLRKVNDLGLTLVRVNPGTEHAPTECTTDHG